ncbi:MAG: HEAT repeat domain-containing protein [Myxococcota bacterium]
MLRKLIIPFALVAGAPACSDVPDPAEASVDDDALVALPVRRLQPGRVHRYDFDWRVAAEAPTDLLGDTPVTGGVHLVGQLQLRVYEDTPEGALVGLRFARLDTHEVLVLGHNALPDVAPLLQAEALMIVPEEGRPQQARVSPDASPIFRHLMGGVLAQLDLSRPPAGARTWTAAGPTANGLAQLQYSRQGDALTRRVRDYLRFDALQGPRDDGLLQVDSHGRIEPHPEGLVDSIELEETIRLRPIDKSELQFGSSTRFSLHRVASELDPAPAPDFGSWPVLDLLAPPDAEAAERELARRFADGLTMHEVAIAIRGATVGLAPEDGFLVRARGLLRGWPERAAELQPLLRDATSLRERAFILDLLLSADTPQSQAVAVEVLVDLYDDHTARLDQLVQHLVLLRNPTEDTLTLLEEVHALASEDGRDRLRRAVLYPIGALARQAAAPLPARSLYALGLLRDALTHASDPDDVIAALAGLGNAAAPEDRDRVLALVDHEDPRVRSQAVESLRFYTDEPVTDVLVAHLDDPELGVASRALGALDRDDPEGVELARLAQAVLDDAVHPELAGALVTALTVRGPDDPRCHEALGALYLRSEDPSLRTRIRRLLDLQPEAGPEVPPP